MIKTEIMKTIQGKKYLWLLPENNQDAVLNFSMQYNIHPALMQVLVSRGYSTKESINEYLFSSFDQDVACSTLLKDVQRSVDRIVRAIKKKEKILIFGDYDVDGITSTAMMISCLLPLGASVNFFLPHRTKDGYGISSDAVKKAARNDYKLIITVDNGITAFDAAQEAKKAGVDLIITDHHCPHENLPDAYAIINPNQTDCSYPFKCFAGVGVAFKVLSLLYEQLGRTLPTKVYELLLLGTVADVVPLIGENRFWVRHGLHQLNKQESFALSVLKKNNKVTKPLLSSLDIAFSIVPQINALGRLADPRQGVTFLIGSKKNEIEAIGNALYALNQERKIIERSIFDEIDCAIKQKSIDLDKENIIVAAHHSWPAGVIGLVASRLVYAYGKPAFLFHIGNDGIARGSCRSIPSFNVFKALHDFSDLLDRFGGHEAAAGLSLKYDNISVLKERLEKRIAEQLTPFDLQQKMKLDAEVTLPDLTKKFMNDIKYLEPFGHKNEQPVFYIKNVSLVKKPLLLKDAHVKCHLFADGVIKPIIFFNRPELFQQLINHGTESFDIAAHVTENYWNGRTNIELNGVDVASLT